MSDELRTVVEAALEIDEETPCTVAEGSLEMDDTDKDSMALLDCDTQKDGGLFS